MPERKGRVVFVPYWSLRFVVSYVRMRDTQKLLLVVAR